MLDPIIECYIERQHELDRIVEVTGLDCDFVLGILQQVDRNEYKRRQTLPGLRVTSKAFGLGRRLPIVMRWNRTDHSRTRSDNCALS